MSRHVRTVRRVVRGLVAVGMVAIGILHFVDPEPFVRIVPPFLPAPLALVYVSGVAEILLGLAILPRKTRRWAALGLVALYVAVFPANVYMAVAGIQLDPSSPMPGWIAWARLPFQLLFIAAALFVRHADPPPSSTARSARGSGDHEVGRDDSRAA